MECVHCKKTEAEVVLQKCPICHKYYCHDDAYAWSGRNFCTKQCAEYFFFADPDD
jgi:hypothetical protein